MILLACSLQFIPLYPGKTAEGKGCKRTTDVVEEKSSPATYLPQGESFTQQV